MSAKPKWCVYCGELTTPADQSKEHCVPKCLWPGKLPNRMMTVPAHRDCNGGYAKDDEYFRNILVAMRGADRHPAARTLIDGKVNDCYTERPHLLRNQLLNLSRRTVMSPGGLYLGDVPAFDVENDRLHRVMDKICRCLFYEHHKRLLASTHVVNWFHLNDDTLELTQQLVSRMEPMRDFGDTVFRYQRYFSKLDPNNAAWFLIFYEAVAFVGRTVPKEVSDGCV
ncbi:hypothetical protein VT84_12410 [Gemmata sp. SH-PL17]|uniref:hypothetical protein n=1 Tax=Gemmata sp. SH-PL17 TaxID=1630693 RepID=UPI00078B866F|nr:hypothetical protein [Gemmata sp. SH-PL17]AMV25193.1 hypothetical protein VT84_12410 [Gemmata sp. SH-PL17]